MKNSTLPSLLFLAAGILCLSLGVASAADVRTGLVSYWQLDADNGGITPDYGAGGNNLTIFGGSAIVAGQFNNAFNFNGTSQYLGITHSTDNTVTGLPIYNSANGYTICFWLKGPPVGTGGNANDRYVFAEGSTASANPLLCFQTRNASVAADTNKLDVIIRTSGNTAILNHKKSIAVVFDNTWHHVAWTDDQGTAKLYVDGNLDATSFNYTYTSGALTMNTTAIGALIRATTAGFSTNTVDEVALWQRVLSQAEINQVRTSSITIPTVPEIVQQPVGSTNAMGDRATFTTTAVGVPPLSYQWFSNSVALVGQTNLNLVLTSLTTSGSNVISLVATNLSGSVTSTFAPFVVLADAPADPSVGLVSYWPMDVVNYGATTNTPDIYYNHTDLGLSNIDQSELVAGQVSNALSFNVLVNAQYGKRSGGSPIYNSTNYTVSFWVNGFPSQLNKQVFAEGGATDYFLLGTENPVSGGGSLNVKMSTGMSDRKSTRTVFDTTWHHVVWVDENGKGKLYVDGVLDETDFTYNRSNLVLNATAVGALYRTTPANYFVGDLDDVAMWSRRLSYTEIQRIRTVGIPLPSIVAPIVTQAPLGSTNHQGDRITLTVTATGTSPAYQWRKDSVPLSGQTTASLPLLLTAAATNDYTVVVTNIAGSVTSAPGHVVVLADPVPNVRAGLFYYWPLDIVTDSAPTNTPDLYSADPFVLANMDSSTLVAGHFGNALSFDGIQPTIRLPSGLTLPPGSSTSRYSPRAERAGTSSFLAPRTTRHPTACLMSK